MLTRKQLDIELKKLQEDNARLRKEILIYNRLQSLNEAHLALALERAGAMEAKPLLVTKEKIQSAMQELAVRVDRDGDDVSLWYEVI